MASTGEPTPRQNGRPTTPQNGRSFIYALSLGLTLAALWIVLSGFFEALLLTYGAISVIAVVLLARRMGLVGPEGFPIHIAWRILLYLPWLTKEIFKSNMDVAKIILDPRLPISPAMSSFRATQRTDLGRVIYANSITLTPGTITTGIFGDQFEIHALTRAALDGTEEGEMGRRVNQLEA